MRIPDRQSQTRTERGATLLLVSIALIALLGVLSLAVDLGMLYVARSEAQRAADAAALAGAKAFLDSGCVSTGCVAGGSQEALARTQAEAVGDQNYVFGQSANVQNSNISFTYPAAFEPQITVVVQRMGIPLVFAKVFGVFAASVKAQATAEAYNPSGGPVNSAVGCVVPFMVPNCDPNSNDTGPAPDANCSGDNTVFINPTTGAIQNPGVYPNGAIGEPWTLHTNAAPSLWYLVQFGSESGADLRSNIEQCSPTPIACGDSIEAMNGKKVGPTVQGVENLIHASGEGLGQGQDVLVQPFPLIIRGGANNPDSGLVGQDFPGPSSAVVVAPVFNGSAMKPGNGNWETVVGFMELFIKDVQHHGKDVPVDAVILNISGCGQQNSGAPTVVAGGGGSPIPIRLIQHPG